MMNNLHEKSEDDYNLFDWWKKAIINNYANFKGRARRKEYWYTALANFVILLPIMIVLGFASFEAQENGEPSILFWVAYGFIVLFALATFIPSIALVVRRLHDVGKSGWFYFIALIPIVGPIILFIQYLTDSQKGENKWGPNPKGVGNNNQLNQIGVKYE